jgi:hypothetical protein
MSTTETQGSEVKLKKLHIGDFSTSVKSQSDAITSSYIEICSVFKYPLGTTRSQNDRATLIKESNMSGYLMPRIVAFIFAADLALQSPGASLADFNIYKSP